MDIPLLFGRYLVKKGLLREDDLETVISVQRELNPTPSVIALEHGLISVEGFRRLREVQRQKGLGSFEAFRETGLLEEGRLEELERLVRACRVRIGEIIVRRGLIGAEALEEALRGFKEDVEG